jgi:CoA:oxalate CoA-transferase
MHDAMVFTNEQAINIFGLLGKLGVRGRSAMSAPFGSFRTKDGWVNIGIGSDIVWKRYCNAVGRPELGEDPRFKLSADRLERLPELDALVNDWTSKFETAQVTEILLKHLVPSAPVFTIPQVLESEQVLARGMWATIDDPIVGPKKVVGNPIKIKGLNNSSISAPPMLGADTVTVMKDYLRMKDNEIAQLISDGVLSTISGDSI